MRTISLKLPEELLDRLEEEARARRVTKSLLIRESLETSLRAAKPGSGLDGIEDLVGCLRGGSSDLAENPRHMDGFGE